MNRLTTKTLFAVGAVSALIGGTILTATPASAQDGAPPPPPPGQGGFGGGQGGQGGGGRGGFGGGRGGFGGQGGFSGMMGGQPLSAATLSLRLMASYLALTDAQVGKIALSRDDMQEAARPAPPRRPAGGDQGGNGGGFGGGFGGGADMQAMFAEMTAKRQSAEKKAVAEIRTILSPEQSTKLATLIKAIESLRTAGYRPEAAGKLQLTDEQLTRIARGGTVETILTPEQATIAETFRMPRGGPGGPGGPGQGRPGGPGGPDGQGAPPPPPQDQR